jgi:hypothetical protein
MEVLSVYSGEAGTGDEAGTIDAIYVSGVGAFRVQGSAVAANFESPQRLETPLPNAQPLPIFSGQVGTSETAPTKEALWVREVGAFQIQGGDLVALSKEPAARQGQPKRSDLVALLSGAVGVGATPSDFVLWLPGVGPLQLQSGTYRPTRFFDPLETTITHGLIPQNLARFSPYAL